MLKTYIPKPSDDLVPTSPPPGRLRSGNTMPGAVASAEPEMEGADVATAIDSG